MTLTELITEVRANIRRAVGTFSDARVTQAVNWAQRTIALEHTYAEMKKRFTGTLSVLARNYSWPSRMKELLGLKIVSGVTARALIYSTEKQFDLDYPDPSVLGTGIPVYYIDYGGSFDLDRLPDSAYAITCRMSQFPVALTGASDSPTLVEKDELLIVLATHMCFRSLREADLATYWFNESKPLFALAHSSDHTEKDWAPVARPFSSGASTSGGGRNHLDPWHSF